MGIDIYTSWKGQNEVEEKKQITGFDITAGNKGYLREAYHGGPYVTKYLVQEAFRADAKISAKVLRERLPCAVLMAMFREKKIYGKGTGAVVIKDFATIADSLKKVFEIDMKDGSHEEFEKDLTKYQIEYAELRIKNRDLPDYALSFVEFVELCELKEKETGEPVEVHASY